MPKTVLIVEDNELNQTLFVDILESRGYLTLRTPDGVTGFEIARARQPDLIVMDIQLPAISGLEITRWIKSDPLVAHIPVLAVTAFAMRGDEARIREAGCEAYLPKPVSLAAFLEEVESLLARSPSRAGPI